MDEKERIRNEFAALAIAEGIAPRFADNYFELMFEIAVGLVSRGEPLLILGIAGAQGTGKSTLAKLLATVVERGFEKTTLVMSLDDFYLTQSERIALAANQHPLLRTRGVPGTHDTALLHHVIDELKAGNGTEVPRFDKAIDDRAGMIPVMGAGLDILIIEGWCWGATPVLPAALEEPINRLEAEQDASGIWRHYVNDQLASGAYQDLFDAAHASFFLKAPDWETVYAWRLQQEQQLATKSAGAAIMNADQVREFVLYYERITRHMLATMPATANLTLFLDEQHQVVRPPRTQRYTRFRLHSGQSA